MRIRRLIAVAAIFTIGVFSSEASADDAIEPPDCLIFGPVENILSGAERKELVGDYSPSENSIITFCYNVYRGYALSKAVIDSSSYELSTEENSCRFWRNQFSEHIRDAPFTVLDRTMPHKDIRENDITATNLVLRYRAVCRDIEADLLDFRAGRQVDELTQLWSYLREIGAMKNPDD